MDFIKKNKLTIIVILIFLIMVILAAKVLNIYVPKDSQSIYGTRLNKVVKISDKTKKEIEKTLESDGIVSKATVRVSGKIIEVITILNAEVDKNTAKGLTNRITEKLTSEQLKAYDIQVFLEKDIESTEFPIIGYKHHNKEHFSWTKDR